MKLDEFPRHPLTFGPSPVHPLDRLSDHLGGARIWAKREDVNSGLAFGGISWCQKMGMSLAGGMGGMLLVLFRYIEPIKGAPQVQSAFTLQGFSLMLTIIPGVFHLLVGILMLKYFITDKYYNENIRELVTHEVINDAE